MPNTTQLKKQSPKKYRRWLKIAGIGIAAIPVLLYIAIIVFYIRNEHSIVYGPSSVMLPIASEIAPSAENVNFQSRNGVTLSGLIIRSNKPTQTWIYYLHGNYGNISTCQDWLKAIHKLDVNVFAIDYRGYGRSPGMPSEPGLYEDAQDGYQFLTTKLGAEPGSVVIYGHSLGSAVAIDLATHVHPAGLIVEGAFRSIVARGQELVPIIPVGLIAKDRFDSESKIGAVSCPKLFLHARDDQMVPIQHGRTLYADATPPKAFLEIYGGHQNAINQDQGEMLRAIRSFLDSTVRQTQSDSR